MKRKLLIGLGICMVEFNAVNAAGLKLSSNSLIKNGHGLVESGSWINMQLETQIVAKEQVQAFVAKTIDPVYNHNFSEVLIPANSIVSGVYNNDGDACNFSINKISFNDTEIDLKYGAYSVVNPVVVNQPGCNPTLSYIAGQLMEFQTKVDIPNLDVVVKVKEGKEIDKGNFIQAYGNPQYTIKDISRFDNGLMQITVDVKDTDIKNKLVPIYYDDYGIVHGLNFKLKDMGNNEYSYLMLSHYDSFGFGIKE